MFGEVDFGQWRDKGKTLPEVLVKDPGWYFWACDAGAFDKYDDLAPQARLLEPFRRRRNRL